LPLTRDESGDALAPTTTLQLPQDMGKTDKDHQTKPVDIHLAYTSTYLIPFSC
jgi:hypothetical protein